MPDRSMDERMVEAVLLPLKCHLPGGCPGCRGEAARILKALAEVKREEADRLLKIAQTARTTLEQDETLAEYGALMASARVDDSAAAHAENSHE